MSMRRLAAAGTIVLLCSAAAAQQGPRLGVPVSEEQIAGWAITVLPNGAGLPNGSGTAREGAGVYERHCIACHGANGAGGPNDQLAGGEGSVGTAQPVRTIGSYWPYATTVFDYIRRAMPYNQPQSLDNDETYAVTAYLLYVNGIIAEDEVVDARTLPQVEMPNRGNFVWAYPEQ